MADELDSVVARFQLDSGSGVQAEREPTNVIDRRRASDWEAPAKGRRSKVA